ncbi:MAG TPA: hypothetical protein PLZ14_12745, partial [Acidovorax temperans]|nr:hypothetical protein [Acidovorax temperans]
MAIVHRISSGRHVLLSDHRQEAADAAAKLLENAGFETTAAALIETALSAAAELAAKFINDRHL